MKNLLVTVRIITLALFVGGVSIDSVASQLDGQSTEKKKLKLIHSLSVPASIKSDNSKFTSGVSCRNQSGTNYFQGDSGFEQCLRETQNKAEKGK